MVTTRNDYEHIAVPSSIDIDGGIYPVRALRNDGSDKILRGVDVAFLAEAACEMNFMRGSSLFPSTLNGSLSQDVMTAIYAGLRDAAPYYIDPAKSVPLTFSSGEYEETEPPPCTFGAYVMGSEAVPEYTERKDLSLDAVKDAYRALLNFRRVVCPLPATYTFNFAHEWSATDAYGNDNSDRFTETGLKDTLYYYSHADEGTVLDNKARAEITTGTLTVVISNFISLYSSAEIWFQFRCRKNNTQRIFASKIDYVKAGNTFTCGEGHVVSALSRVRSFAGMRDEPTNETVVNEITIGPPIVLAVPRDHSRIDDLGWNG